MMYKSYRDMPAEVFKNRLVNVISKSFDLGNGSFGDLGFVVFVAYRADFDGNCSLTKDELDAEMKFNKMSQSSVDKMINGLVKRGWIFYTPDAEKPLKFNMSKIDLGALIAH